MERRRSVTLSGGWLLTELKHECGHVLTEILLHSYGGQLRAPAKTDLSLLLLTLLNIHTSGVMGLCAKGNSKIKSLLHQRTFPTFTVSILNLRKNKKHYL